LPDNPLRNPPRLIVDRDTDLPLKSASSVWHKERFAEPERIEDENLLTVASNRVVYPPCFVNTDTVFGSEPLKKQRFPTCNLILPFFSGFENVYFNNMLFIRRLSQKN
jgi:hypothetical protein